MTNPGAPLVAVDLSNLCRDRRLLAPGVKADLALTDRFRDGLESSGISYRDLLWISDRSLLPLLSRQQRKHARKLESHGELELCALADERLLELAFGEDAEPGTVIASMDNFDDFRRTYSAIQGSKDRFLTWDPDPNHGLHIRFRDMKVHSHLRLSRKEESAELKARRLIRADIIQRAEASYFRCESPNCLLAGLWPNRLPELPRFDDRTGQFICPSCRAPIQPISRRPAAEQVIVFFEGAERFRVLIEEDQEISIGRTDGPNRIGLASRIRSSNVDAVSRSHLNLALTGQSLAVEDMGSRNGTILRRANDGTETRLAPGERHSVRAGDIIALPGGITLELSGRRVPKHAGDPKAKDETELPERATRVLASRP